MNTLLYCYLLKWKTTGYSVLPNNTFGSVREEGQSFPPLPPYPPILHSSNTFIFLPTMPYSSNSYSHSGPQKFIYKTQMSHPIVGFFWQASPFNYVLGYTSPRSLMTGYKDPVLLNFLFRYLARNMLNKCGREGGRETRKGEGEANIIMFKLLCEEKLVPF